MGVVSGLGQLCINIKGICGDARGRQWHNSVTNGLPFGGPVDWPLLAGHSLKAQAGAQSSFVFTKVSLGMQDRAWRAPPAKPNRPALALRRLGPDFKGGVLPR